MGEAAPAHAAAARPAVFPLLGAGMVGPGPPGASSRTAAVPPLHSAIVERLRARIELCRRHHSTCERRYERGRAESSERERESTLQLLSLVQQGGAARRGKSGRALDQSRGNNEHKGQSAGETESKASTRIALQGSLRRKIEGQPSGYTAKQNGLSCVGAAPDFKRLRMEAGSLRPGPCAMTSGQSSSLAGSVALGHTLRRKDPFMMPHGVGSDLFNMTLREMKKEPIDVQPCSHSSMDPAMMVFDFKDEGGGQIDPELQDLFDELTKSVPPLNDLELEKMLKQDDDFGLDLGRPSSAGAAHPCPHLDKPIKTEYSPDYGQASGSSPQLRPASAGPSFTALSTSPIGQMTHNHVSSGTPTRGLPTWPEMSHAEQLKQMAANQQQPSSLLHHQQQQSQAGGVRNWSSVIGGHPSASCFGQETVGSSGSLSQPRISPQSAGQSKGMPNCIFKPGAYNSSNSSDMKVLGSKPMLHFTPKTASSTASQQMPHMAGSQSKLATQQQPSTVGQSMQFQMSSSCLQPKPANQRPPLNQHGLGINLKMTQRQAMAPGPRLSANGCLAGIGQPQQQRSPAPNTPKNTGKGQRQLSQPQHHTSDTEKFNTQDQFNRHLTRPPPDYKQPQGVAGVQHPSLYPGLASSPLTNNASDQSDIPSLSCHLPNGQGAKMVPNSGDRMFHSRSDPHSGPVQHEVQTCASQLHQQPNNQVQIGIHQNKAQFQGANTQVVTFPGVVPTTQHVRTSAASQDTILGQGLSGITTTASRESGLSWVSDTKQNNGLQGLDVKRQTDTHFPPRPIGPPNQVAPHSGLIPLNPAIRGSAPRAGQPHIPPLPGVSNLNQPSPEQQGCMSTFMNTAQSPGTYQNSRAGRLTFDFLQDGDNTVPGINADSDFIDSLLKSGSGNDDWMKDINLEEILGGHS